MKVVSLSTFDISGGAARAAHRQHQALRQAGVDHWMLVGNKRSEDAHVIAAAVNPDSPQATHVALTQRFAIDQNRTPVSNTWFSFPLFDAEVAKHELLRDADIIHLHWTSGFISLDGIANLMALGKPVVFTLHDQWALTGGCHYTSGCEKFLTGCQACPQLALDPVGVPAVVWNQRLKLGQATKATVISPSHWLHQLASASPTLSNWRHEVIPNAVDGRVFQPRDQREAREALGLRQDAWQVMLIAEQIGEHRKGLADLTPTILNLHSVADRPVAYFSVGHGQPHPQWEGKVVSLGSIAEEARLATIYAAADVLLLPSHEDNLPNTMVEALACGTPVVGYRIGGLPDCIVPGRTGELATRGDAEGLTAAVKTLLQSPLETIRRNCRELSEQTTAYPMHAQRCIDLFERLLREAVSTNSSNVDKHVPRSIPAADPVVQQAALELLISRIAVLQFKVDEMTARSDTHMAQRDEALRREAVLRAGWFGASRKAAAWVHDRLR